MFFSSLLAKIKILKRIQKLKTHQEDSFRLLPKLGKLHLYFYPENRKNINSETFQSSNTEKRREQGAEYSRRSVNLFARLQIVSEFLIVMIGAFGGVAVATILGATVVPVTFLFIPSLITPSPGIEVILIPSYSSFIVFALIGGIISYLLAKAATNGARVQGGIQEIKNQAEERWREAEARSHSAEITIQDRIKFIIFLDKPLKLNLIDGKDAEDLVTLLESGKITLEEAYQEVSNLLNAYNTTKSGVLATTP